jgi:hypothetical protein
MQTADSVRYLGVSYCAAMRPSRTPADSIPFVPSLDLWYVSRQHEKTAIMMLIESFCRKLDFGLVYSCSFVTGTDLTSWLSVSFWSRYSATSVQSSAVYLHLRLMV